MSQDHAWRIAHVTRLMVNHFIPRINNRPQGKIKRFAHPNGHEDLVFRVVEYTEVFFDIRADRLPKFEQAEIGSVTRPSPFQSVNGGFANMPGSDKVRFPYAKGNNRSLVLHQFKKFSNPRARDVADVARYKRIRLEWLGHG